MTSRRGLLALSMALVVLVPAITFVPVVFVCRVTGSVSIHSCCAAPSPVPHARRVARARRMPCCSVSVREVQAVAAPPSRSLVPLLAVRRSMRLDIQQNPVGPLAQASLAERSRAPPRGPRLFIEHSSLLI